MTHPNSSPTDGHEDDGVNLRLIWPQWQGGDKERRNSA